MDLLSVNWIVILIAVAANMLLGYLWFGPLFGKRWRKEIGTSQDELPQGLSRYVYLLVYSFLSALVFWHLLPVSPFSPIMTAVLLWFVFSSAPTFVSASFSGRDIVNWEDSYYWVGTILTALIIDTGLR